MFLQVRTFFLSLVYGLFLPHYPSCCIYFQMFMLFISMSDCIDNLQAYQIAISFISATLSISLCYLFFQFWMYGFRFLILKFMQPFHIQLFLDHKPMSPLTRIGNKPQLSTSICALQHCELCSESARPVCGRIGVPGPRLHSRDTHCGDAKLHHILHVQLLPRFQPSGSRGLHTEATSRTQVRYRPLFTSPRIGTDNLLLCDGEVKSALNTRATFLEVCY